jgi:hypothetical protein
MNPGFQEGRRPRANAVASLAHTGHVSPLGRRPGVGTVAHAHKPSTNSRPGPSPMSARQTAAVNQWNAATKRVVAQFLRDAQNTSRQRAFSRENAAAEAEWSDRATQRAWESKPFPSYDPRKDHAYDVDVVDAAGWATGYHGHKFGELWVYIRAKGPHNTLEYAVLNPQTGNLLVFAPEAAVAPQNRVYLSEADQVRGIAAGTGVAGGYLEKGFLGLTVGAVAAPYALAGAVALSESAVAGVVVTGFRTLGTQMVKQFTWSKFGMKVGSDLAVQFSGGMMKHHGDLRATVGDINGTSLFVSWLLPAAGWTSSLRNAVLKSTFKATVDVTEFTNPRIKVALPQLNSMESFGNYLTAIGLDVAGDRLKSTLVKGMAPVWARSMVTLRQSGSELGRWVAANRIAMGMFGQIATSLAIKTAKDQEKERMAKRFKQNPPKTDHPWKKNSGSECSPM